MNRFSSLVLISLVLAFVVGCTPSEYIDGQEQNSQVAGEVLNGRFYSLASQFRGDSTSLTTVVIFLNDNCQVKSFSISPGGSVIEILKPDQILPGDRFKIVRAPMEGHTVYTIMALPDDSMSRCNNKTQLSTTSPASTAQSTPEPIFKQTP